MNLCLAGLYCCDGESGGNGGPGNSDDIGCCQKPCGNNNWGQCEYD
jgi:hypothetical protein